jgi:hypothetical protein
MKWSDVEWTDVIYVKWFYFEVKWSEVKWVTAEVLGTKVPCTLGWPYTEGTWLYCDYFVLCASCTVVVLPCFVMCVYVLGVLIIHVLVFTVFCSVCTVFL